MAEWSKAHAWKVCNRQKWFMGSNPILSANQKLPGAQPGDFYFRKKPSSLALLDEIKSPY